MEDRKRSDHFAKIEGENWAGKKGVCPVQYYRHFLCFNQISATFRFGYRIQVKRGLGPAGWLGLAQRFGSIEQGHPYKKLLFFADKIFNTQEIRKRCPQKFII